MIIIFVENFYLFVCIADDCLFLLERRKTTNWYLVLEWRASKRVVGKRVTFGKPNRNTYNLRAMTTREPERQSRALLWLDFAVVGFPKLKTAFQARQNMTQKASLLLAERWNFGQYILLLVDTIYDTRS